MAAEAELEAGVADGDLGIGADASRTAATTVDEVPYLSASEPRLLPRASRLMCFCWADKPPSGVLGGVDVGGGGGGESRGGAGAARGGPREVRTLSGVVPSAAERC